MLVSEGLSTWLGGAQARLPVIQRPLSTHLVLRRAGEKLDRESILDGMRKRHTYGATDDIICDIRSGTHIMGDEFKTGAAPELQVHVIGTKGLKTVEVVKDSKVVAELKCTGRECKETWTDPNPSDGVHYYYVRVRQTDGELAWTSPMWIEWRK